jgi:hypothetical protein
MKRAAEWALYVIGALAVGYLGLYLYSALTRPNLQPGDPIRIFRKPDAPNYSAMPSSCAAASNLGDWVTRVLQPGGIRPCRRG